MDYGFKQWLKQTVIRKPFLTMDGSNEPTFKTSETLKCLCTGATTWGGGIRITNSRTGQIVLASKIFYFDETVTLDIRDRFISEGREYPILVLNPIREFDGTVYGWEAGI